MHFSIWMRLKSIIPAILMLTLLGGHAYAYTNLLTNGGFETGSLSGWENSGATAYNAQAHSGSWSARMANASIRTPISVTAGATYKVTGWVRIISDSGSDWGGVAFSAMDPTVSPWQYIAGSPNVSMADYGTGWVKLAFSFKAPGNAVYIRAGYDGGSGRQVIFLMDDIEFFVKPAANTPPSITSASLTPANVTSLSTVQNFSVSFNDVDGAVTGVRWDFGDGGRATTFVGTRTVLMNGNFTAVVRISDDEGAITTQNISWSASDAALLSVSITSPAADTTVSNATLAMSGTATGSGIAIKVSTDRDEVVNASGTSSWTANVPLKPGNNRLIVQAHDNNGRIETAERRVRYVPSGTLRVSNMQEDKTTVDRWNPVEITFNIDNSAATDLQFPYEPPANLPPGLGNLDGISVEGLFTPDNWISTYRRPGFLKQPYVNQGGMLVPSGNPVWCVRFAPPILGAWQYRIEVREAKGAAQSAVRGFTAVPTSDVNNHGPVWRSATDRRYFEYADGTPFLGVGIDAGGDAQLFNAAGTTNENFCRWWITDMWGSAWWSWNSRTLGHGGIVPLTGLTLDAAYADGLGSLRIDNANPISFQGAGFNAPIFTRGKQYLARIRWRSDNITGPVTAGKPYGACVRFMDWPEVGQTSDKRLVIPHLNGSTPWHVVWATFTATDAYFSGCLNATVCLIFENAKGGAAYIDEFAIHEVNPDGSPGNQVLRHSKMNSHLHYDGAASTDHEQALYQANALNICFKLNISEKQEYLINHLGASGLPDPKGGNFNNRAGTPNHRLHEYFWRYLSARFGALRSVHSFEVTNEEAPGDGEHFQLTEDLARQIQADGNPHMGNTSTWASLAEDAWNNHPDILFADFHAYLGATAWDVGVPTSQLINDTALAYQEYDADARAAYTGAFLKPVVWGEFGITPDGNSDNPDPRLMNDTQGVWLHKLVWARTGPGITIPLSWHNTPIWSNNLHPIFGRWRKFMAGIPFTNGRYVDAAATSANTNIRVFGQKDSTGGRAHLWIDNKTHTWGNVVSSPGNITVQNGTVTLDMGTMNANATFSLKWYDTWLGQDASVGSATANSAGVVSFSLSNLTKDMAVKLVRTDGGNTTPPVAPRDLRIETVQ